MTLLRLVQKEAGQAGPMTLDGVRPVLERIAGEWGCEVLPSMEMLFPPFQGKPGLLLLPEIMFRKQGILVSAASVSGLPARPQSGELPAGNASSSAASPEPPAGPLSAELPKQQALLCITIEREEDATTWEDFLLMKLAHTAAQEFGAELTFGEENIPMAVEPGRFETFEHYVDKVLEFEDELVKEMKKVWIYNHRKRALR